MQTPVRLSGAAVADPRSSESSESSESFESSREWQQCAVAGPSLRAVPEPQQQPHTKASLDHVQPAHAASAEGERSNVPGVEGGGGTRVHAMDMDRARGRSHEPTAVRPALGLGWPESAHHWTGTPGRAASLDCSGRSGESDAGRARFLDRVEGGDPRRTGPPASHDPSMCRWSGWYADPDGWSDG